MTLPPPSPVPSTHPDLPQAIEAPDDSPEKICRLEGDALYTWAMLISTCKHAQANLDGFGGVELRARGFDPDRYSITNEGWIFRTSAADRIDPRPDPPSPDSES